MSGWISKEEVNNYLIRIKTAISEGRYIWRGNRKKNLDALARAGLLIKHVPGIIMQLTYLNYFNGPEPEENEQFLPGEYMFFGHSINGYEFYIKVKIEKQENEEFCMCLSFHNPEKPIIYAFKRN